MTLRANRRGISLIEVLMSMFIISIGIIGVLSVIYVGHYQTDRGLTSDRGAAAGRAALSEFMVRGMDCPKMWRTPAGALLATADGSTGANAPYDLAGNKKFLLDPRGAACGVTGTFPAQSGAATQIPRITLCDQLYTSAGAPSTVAMPIKQADEWFCMHDDLHFTVADNDPAAVPLQTLEKSPTSVNEKRFSSREFSWVASIIKEMPGDQYTVSIAVVQNRNKTVTAELQAEEAEFGVTFLGGGVSGGDVTLAGAATTKPMLETLVPGKWLMLCSGERARWYRVISVSEMNGNNRDVTLVGRDWDTAGSYATPKAVVLANVVGVYERTMRPKQEAAY
jgi:hypothetical protein